MKATLAHDIIRSHISSLRFRASFSILSSIKVKRTLNNESAGDGSDMMTVAIVIMITMRGVIMMTMMRIIMIVMMIILIIKIRMGLIMMAMMGINTKMRIMIIMVK